jgi:hypothetical protein
MAEKYATYLYIQKVEAKQNYYVRRETYATVVPSKGACR